ncbi:hypothetical protein BDM02DRAFT_3188752 [Thelephora ganbajun]|uniref:Uncharacterized protein n=1 Tax=Thelephora ganbajun TaxID=370292 RepID=A0ACB6ZBM6_THEGA|nr:hypothetical protein BDM02DRAFT_3188752 [Thelephora ganbajun]
MDIVGLLVQGARDLTTAKYILISAIAVTLYDYLLTFNDEIRYVWRGRKTWIFYLYMLNRTLLIAYQFWEIYYTVNQRNSKVNPTDHVSPDEKLWSYADAALLLRCLAGYYVQVLLIMFFLFSSDIFITLRVYAITFKNKMLVVYFGTLALARLAMSLASAFTKPPAIIDLPRIPVDAFNLCGIMVTLQFKLVPNAIGTAFGE